MPRFLCCFALVALAGCASREPEAPITIASAVAEAKKLGLVTDLKEAAEHYKPLPGDASALLAALTRSRDPNFKIIFQFGGNKKVTPQAAQAIAALDAKKYERAAIVGALPPTKNWSEGAEMKFVELAAAKDAMRFFIVRAKVRAAAGEVKSAVADLKFGASLITRTTCETGLIGKLVTVALISMWVPCVSAVAASTKDSGQIDSITSIVNSVAEPDLRQCIGFEIAIARNMMGDVKAKQTDIWTQFQKDVGARTAEIWDQEEAELISNFVRAARLWNDRDELSKFTKKLDPNTSFADPGGFYSGQLVGILGRVKDAELRAGALLRMCRIGLASYQMFSGSGRWPTISEAASAAKVSPTDPFSGSNYMFDTTNDRLQIYSVGANGLDEKGSKVKPADDVVGFSTR